MVLLETYFGFDETVNLIPITLQSDVSYMSNRMNKEGSDTLDPLAKSVRHMPKPIPSLFSALYIERECDERDERRPLKECPNRLDPLAKVVQHVPKPIPSLFFYSVR